MKYQWLIIILFLLGCSEKKPKQPSIEKNEDRMPLQDYLISEFKQDSTFQDWHISNDTLNINSLDINLYRARSAFFDDDEYVLIKDLQSGSVFKIVVPGWHPFGLSQVDPDLQLQILESQQPIETINFQFIGLEAFLNHSSVLSDKFLSMEALDSILMYWNPMLTRIETYEDLVRPLQPQGSTDNVEWSKRVKEALNKRLSCKYALLYEYVDASIYYFEINPFSDCWRINENHQPYDRPIRGNMYNLRSMIIYNSRQ